MLSVSVVMFAYNEAENVEACLAEALDFLRSATSDHEIVFVSDGSTDDTAAVAQAFADKQESGEMKVISYSPNRGIGGALKAGFAEVTKDWVTLLPCDGQLPPEGLQNLFDVVLQDGSVDIVTCHYPDRFQEADTFYRKVLSRGLRGLMWATTGVHRKLDGVYLLKRGDLHRLPLKSDTFFLNLELPIRGIRGGLNPGATTMNLRPRMAGESKVANMRRMRKVLKDLVSLGVELRTTHVAPLR
jgi:glycosyltransferase involved in cell wall biosynthesis